MLGKCVTGLKMCTSHVLFLKHTFHKNRLQTIFLNMHLKFKKTQNIVFSIQISRKLIKKNKLYSNLNLKKK